MFMQRWEMLVNCVPGDLEFISGSVAIIENCWQDGSVLLSLSQQICLLENIHKISVIEKALKFQKLFTALWVLPKSNPSRNSDATDKHFPHNKEKITEHFFSDKIKSSFFFASSYSLFFSRKYRN